MDRNYIFLPFFYYVTRRKRLSVYKFSLSNTTTIYRENLARSIPCLWAYRTQRASGNEYEPCRYDSPKAQRLPRSCTGKLPYSRWIFSEASRAIWNSLRDLWYLPIRVWSTHRYRAVSWTTRKDRIIPQGIFFDFLHDMYSIPKSDTIVEKTRAKILSSDLRKVASYQLWYLYQPFIRNQINKPSIDRVFFRISQEKRTHKSLTRWKEVIYWTHLITSYLCETSPFSSFSYFSLEYSIWNSLDSSVSIGSYSTPSWSDGLLLYFLPTSWNDKDNALFRILCLMRPDLFWVHKESRKIVWVGTMKMRTRTF